MLKESDYKQQMEHVLFASCLPSPKAIHHPSIDSVAMPLEIKLFIVTKKKGNQCELYLALLFSYALSLAATLTAKSKKGCNLTFGCDKLENQLSLICLAVDLCLTSFFWTAFHNLSVFEGGNHFMCVACSNSHAASFQFQFQFDRGLEVMAHIQLTTFYQFSLQFPGCNKAFSRLENLKIHQRSHTGY